MKQRSWIKWILLLALVLPLALVACGGEAEPTEAPVAEPTEAPMEEPTDEPMEEPMDEPTEEPTEEPMDEPTEEPMDEGPADTVSDASMNGIEECVVATDGEWAGVDPSGAEIIWWHNHTGDRNDLLNELITQFNETNACGITVEGQSQGSYGDIRNLMNASLGAGDVPNALVVGYQNDQAFYQLQEGLADFNTFLDDPTWGLTEEDQDDFYPTFFDQSVHPVFDNQRLGFPPNRSMEVLFYNQSWLEELGYEGPPTTPEEFREMACAGAEARGDGTGGYILRDDASAMAAWTFAFGGDVLNEAGDAYVYDSDATVEAMSFLKEMLDDGCAYLFTEGFPNPELAGRRALFTQGSSSGIPFYEGDFNTVAEDEGREPDVWGVTAIPHTTDEPVQNIYGGDIMITADRPPEERLAAWVFVKWLTSPEIQAEWVRISGYFPTRESTNEFIGDYVNENPQWGQALEMLPYAYYEPQLISYEEAREGELGAVVTFNEIMQLPADATEDDIRALLTTMTEWANQRQQEMMAIVEDN